VGEEGLEGEISGMVMTGGRKEVVLAVVFTDPGDGPPIQGENPPCFEVA
jgi:hypothetical protein